MGAEGRLPGFRFFLGATLLVAILYWAQAIFMPVALAILLTFLLAPVVGQLQRWGLNRSLSVALVVLVTVCLLGGMIWLATTQIRNLADELPHYRANMRQKIGDLRKLQKSSTLERLNDVLGEVRGELSKDDKTGGPKADRRGGRQRRRWAAVLLGVVKATDRQRRFGLAAADLYARSTRRIT